MSPVPQRSARRLGAPEGAVTVHVADEQAVEPDLDLRRWQALAEGALAAEGVAGEVEVSVLFVEADAIAELNRAFLGGDGPTDVLSFPIDGDVIDAGRNPDGGTPGPQRELPDPRDLPLLLGDVVICPSVARANAADHAGSFDDELALLLVHGLLHLLGHDHAEVDERVAMQARERALLADLWGPLAGDPWQAVDDGPAGSTTGASGPPAGGAGPSAGDHPAAGDR